MNTARLGNLWQDAAGDTHKMAAALGEELANSHFATKADLNELRADLKDLKAELYRAMGLQGIAIVGITVALIKLLP